MTEDEVKEEFESAYQMLQSVLGQHASRLAETARTHMQEGMQRLRERIEKNAQVTANLANMLAHKDAEEANDFIWKTAWNCVCDDNRLTPAEKAAMEDILQKNLLA